MCSKGKFMKGKVNKIYRYEYNQAIQILKLSLQNIQSPYIAALLSIVFNNSNERESLVILERWLYDYIEHFILSKPRDQTDLIEKTLAIVTYINIEDPENTLEKLPGEFIGRYLDYASKQDWYDNSFLAFMSSLSINKNSLCVSGRSYLERNFPSYMAQANIEAISQTLFVQTSILEADIDKGVMIIRDYISSSTEPLLYAWSLLVLSKYENQENLNLQINLIDELYKSIVRIIVSFFPSNNFLGTDGYIEKNILNSEKFNGKLDYLASLFSYWILDYYRKNLGLLSTNLDELCLIIACLYLSNSYYFVAVVGIPENKIKKIIDDSLNIDKGTINISRQANTIGNFLAFIMTIIFVIIILYLIFKLRILVSPFKVTATLGWEGWVFIVMSIDYLLSQVQAMKHGRSALEGMIQFPILRHIQWLKRRDI